MKLKVFCLSTVLAMLPATVIAMPSCSATFSESDLRITPYIHDDDTFDVVGLGGANALLGQVGLPSLPVRRLYMLIPQDCRVASVNITYLDTSSLSGDYYVLPGQLPAPTNGGPPPPFVEPDSVAYSSTSLYPDCFAACIAEGFSSGYKVAEIEVNPVRYVASGLVPEPSRQATVSNGVPQDTAFLRRAGRHQAPRDASHAATLVRDASA